MFNASTSTFIVECPPETWERAGFASMDDATTCRYLETVFAEDLDGHLLLTNNFVRWLNFPLVKNERWHHERVVLLGDALHTAHFSIGSGTKLALEDAIALAQAFDGDGGVEAALARFRAHAQAGGRRAAAGGLREPAAVRADGRGHAPRSAHSRVSG